MNYRLLAAPADGRGVITTRLRQRWHRGAAGVSVRVLLVGAVLVPTLAMTVVVGGSVRTAWQDRRSAEALKHEVARLVEIVDARAKVADEEVGSSALLVATSYGLDAADLERLSGVDYEAELAAARAVLDADPVIAASPQLRTDLTRLAELRPGVDDRTGSFDRVSFAIRQLKQHIDLLFAARLRSFQSSAGFAALPAGSRDELDVLGDTFLMFTAANERATGARVLLSEQWSRSAVELLVSGTARFEALVVQVSDRLGPEGRRAWRQFQADPMTQAFEEMLDLATDVGLSGDAPPFLDRPAEFGEAFAGGASWFSQLTGTVRGAAEDLDARAGRDADAATRSVVIRTLVATVLVLVSVGAAAVVARTMARPTRRLGEAANEIRDGNFDLTPLDPAGPRELAQTASAFNEMATTLAAVEAQAVLLAEEPGAPAPPPLPGRTGRALHSAFEQLRASIGAAEERREQLHELAIHDSLTGLLNRAAVLEALERDLARVDRDGGQVMALFLDLDGLKGLNDRHGHEAGDEALRGVAAALRSTTREADAVARYGGDEFLVVGLVDGRVEVELLAERVRTAVAATVLERDGLWLQLRCSIGMAMAIGIRGGLPERTADDVIADADAALYAAKNAGRDQSVWAPLLTGPTAG
jgi:diguanylate cyclase (GGDEF)-like protein